MPRYVVRRFVVPCCAMLQFAAVHCATICFVVMGCVLLPNVVPYRIVCSSLCWHYTERYYVVPYWFYAMPCYIPLLRAMLYCRVCLLWHFVLCNVILHSVASYCIRICDSMQYCSILCFAFGMVSCVLLNRVGLHCIVLSDAPRYFATPYDDVLHCSV